MAFGAIALLNAGFGLVKRKVGPMLVKGVKLASKDSGKWFKNNFKLSGRGADEIGATNAGQVQSAMAGMSTTTMLAVAAGAFLLLKK